MPIRNICRMQIYLMWTGVVVAYIFTSIPQWTTWVLLVAMALYDLFAVLTPSGPLQMLVNLAMERDEDIPALVYEAREVRRPRRRNAASSEPQGVAEGRAVGGRGSSATILPESSPPHQELQGGMLLEDTEVPWGRSSANMGARRGTYRGGRAMGESQEPHGRDAQPGQGFGQLLDSELARLHRPPVRSPLVVQSLMNRRAQNSHAEPTSRASIKHVPCFRKRSSYRAALT